MMLPEQIKCCFTLAEQQELCSTLILIYLIRATFLVGVRFFQSVNVVGTELVVRVDCQILLAPTLWSALK